MTSQLRTWKFWRRRLIRAAVFTALFGPLWAAAWWAFPTLHYAITWIIAFIPAHILCRVSLAWAIADHIKEKLNP